MISIFGPLVVRSILASLLWIDNVLVHSHLVVPELPAEIILDEKLSSALVVASPCEKACLDITSHLGNAVYLGQSGDKFDFWDAKKREIIPACRVEPVNGQEMSSILKTLVSHGCHFIVKSGGHERGTPGSDYRESSVVIDLVKMKDLQVADDKKSVTIGPGWRWSSLYQALEKYDLMVLGGRVGEVGVGGLLLGGGISFHSNWRGLACDSIIAYEMVFPNATIATVNQNTHPKLYRALRGGGATNFGIVTSFTLETFPQRLIWYGQKMFRWDSLPELLEANHHITTNAMNFDPHISIMNVFMCYPKHRLCFGNILAQHAAHNTTSTWPLPFKNHEAIGAMEQTALVRLGSMSNITSSLDDSTRKVRYRNIYATFTYIPSVELEQQLLAIFREEAEHASLKNVTGFSPGIIMHPFSETMLRKTRKRGGNAFSSIANHNGPLTISNIAWQWDEKMDDITVYASYRRTMERLEEAARQMGLWHPYKYINYAEAAQDVFGGYGSTADLQELKELQQDLDPLGIFAEGGLAGGAFKLVGATAGPSLHAGSPALSHLHKQSQKDEL